MNRNTHVPELRDRDDSFNRSIVMLQSIIASDETRRSLIQQTREYRDFQHALEQLEMVHRNVSSSKDDSGDGLCWSHDPSITLLQYLAPDEVILRIFSYLDCLTLLNVGATCHRFHDLANTHAKERSRPMVARRQISPPMVLLKAYEQMMIGNYASGSGSSSSSNEQIPKGIVPIPTLLLPKCIRVRDCGDADYNGVYFCTGCNGNGYVFTKPRYPVQPRPVVGNLDSTRHIDALDTGECYGAEREQPLRCIIAKRFSEEVRKPFICELVSIRCCGNSST